MFFGYYVKNLTFCFVKNVKNRKMFVFFVIFFDLQMKG